MHCAFAVFFAQIHAAAPGLHQPQIGAASAAVEPDAMHPIINAGQLRFEHGIKPLLTYAQAAPLLAADDDWIFHTPPSEKIS